MEWDDPQNDDAGAGPPTSVRLPAGLRERLLRESRIAGRSLSQEMVHRLRDSLEGPQGVPTSRVQTMEMAPAPYPGIPDAQRRLLALYAQLSPEKQLALLTFLRR